MKMRSITGGMKSISETEAHLFDNDRNPVTFLSMFPDSSMKHRKYVHGMIGYGAFPKPVSLRFIERPNTAFLRNNNITSRPESIIRCLNLWKCTLI